MMDFHVKVGTAGAEGKGIDNVLCAVCHSIAVF